MAITINGSGTVTGISAGGLPDGVITPADLAQPLTLGTAQASTSGTFIDFTGIPSWVKRITVMFNGVSISGSSNSVLVQHGSGSFKTSGYLSTSARQVNATSSDVATSTSGFVINSALAANLLSGAFALTNITGNTWICVGNIQISTGQTAVITTAGVDSLSGTLDRIRITTINGTDTFDGGTINILYE